MRSLSAWTAQAPYEREMIGHLSANGMENRTLLEEAAKTTEYSVGRSSGTPEIQEKRGAGERT